MTDLEALLKAYCVVGYQSCQVDMSKHSIVVTH